MRLTTYILFAILLLSCSTGPKRNYEVVELHDLAKITTSEGEILFILYDQTPKHKESFIKLAEAQYFNSYTFNRVIDNFVAQGGCPDTPDGFGDSPYLLKPEFSSELSHIYGAIGAGRDDNPNMLSAGCQFYIVQNKSGLHRLDNKYTVFGQVIKGMDVVDRIVKVETDTNDQPLTPINLRVEIIKLDSLEIRDLLEKASLSLESSQL